MLLRPYAVSDRGECPGEDSQTVCIVRDDVTETYLSSFVSRFCSPVKTLPFQRAASMHTRLNLPFLGLTRLSTVGTTDYR